jgi:hypothetical protein
MWTVFLAVVCGIRAQRLSAPFSYTLYISYVLYPGSRDSLVGIATGYGLEDRGVGIRVPVVSRISLLHVVQTDSGAYPSSYSMGNGGSFPGG